MRRIGSPVLVLTLVFVFGLTACSPSPGNASPSPSEAPTQSSQPVSQSPTAPTAEAALPLASAATATQNTEPTPTAAATTAADTPTAQASPSVAATLPQPSATLTLVPAATSSPTTTPTGAAAGAPVGAPSFDITNRTQPPVDSETAYLQWMQSNSPEGQDYAAAKWARAQAVIANGDVTDTRVLQAFLRAPRGDFFNASSAAQAYASAVYPIGYGQTISGPHLVCRMTQAIDPQPNQKVLEVGTGSGYQSAVLSELSNHVFTVEIVPQLAQKADARYTALTKSYPEYANVRRKNADGYYGWPEYAPFDRIIVTAGIDHVPPDLLAQLAPGGIMVIPVGPPSGQTVLKITKQVQTDGTITFVREDIYRGQKVLFVPFTGGHQGQ